ncbi:MAG: PspA-associated protein PspAA [Chloroflexota bacterium]
MQGSGQYRLADADVQTLHELDQRLVGAVHAGDEVLAHQVLGEMIALVQGKGSVVGDDELVASDTVLPHDSISVAEVGALLQHESLVGSAG